MQRDKSGRPVLIDGTIKTTIHDHPGHGLVQVETVQTNRDAILARNAQARKDNCTVDLEWGMFALNIPEWDLIQLKKKNPELAGPEPGRTQAWKRFMRSSESIPYRVVNKI